MLPLLSWRGFSFDRARRVPVRYGCAAGVRAPDRWVRRKPDRGRVAPMLAAGGVLGCAAVTVVAMKNGRSGSSCGEIGAGSSAAAGGAQGPFGLPFDARRHAARQDDPASPSPFAVWSGYPWFPRRLGDRGQGSAGRRWIAATGGRPGAAGRWGSLRRGAGLRMVVEVRIRGLLLLRRNNKKITEGTERMCLWVQ